MTRCRDDARSAENTQTHPNRAKNCSLLDSKVIFNKKAGHNLTGSNNVYHRNLNEDEYKVSSSLDFMAEFLKWYMYIKCV